MGTPVSMMAKAALSGHDRLRVIVPSPRPVAEDAVVGIHVSKTVSATDAEADIVSYELLDTPYL